MKLLIACDGSKSADAAQNDFVRAGLPRTGEALVMTVAEVWLPPPPSGAEIPAQSKAAKNPAEIEKRYLKASRAVKDAMALAEKAAARFRSSFPKWRVRAQASWGSPTWELFETAENIEADLIVVGSHGRTALGGRIFLGSISQWLLNEARCSVRIGRGGDDEPDFPVRLVVGVDGSRNANQAVDQIGARHWPAKSEVRVVVVDRPLEPTVIDKLIPAVGRTVEALNREQRRYYKQLAEAAAKRLNAKGLRAKPIVKEGDPRKVLVEFAEKWRADCIFLGATGLSNRLDRFLLGSVAGAVAARAHCSVEIVRNRKPRRRPRAKTK